MTIRYPKLLALAIAIAAAYVLGHFGFFERAAFTLNARGYASMFLAGLLFAFGFTAPFAVGFFIELADTVHPVIGALLGGLGALCADLAIFKFIRFTFQDEFEKLRISNLGQWIRELFDGNFSQRLKKYFVWSVAGLIIASPLPDEFGITLLSGFTRIKPAIFAVISFSLNSLGIFAVLQLG